MRTSIEFPDSLFREAKATAARRGQSLKEFVTEAVREKLTARLSARLASPPWLRFFGAAKERSLSRGLDEIDSSVRQAREEDIRLQSEGTP